MRIDNTLQQQVSSLGMQPGKEVAGERENDGDADDGAQAASRTLPANQLYAQGIGNKIDLLA